MCMEQSVGHKEMERILAFLGVYLSRWTFEHFISGERRETKRAREL